MAVVGVLTQTDIRDHRRVRLGGDLAGRALDDTVVGVRPRAAGVLRLGDAEEEHRLHTRLGHLPDAVGGLVDRHAFVARHRLDGDAVVGGRVDEDRCDQIRRRETGLGDQRSQAVRP